MCVLTGIQESFTSVSPYEVGDLVKLAGEGAEGSPAVVSRAIGPGQPGHVLVAGVKGVEGVDVTWEQVAEADETDDGFAQLAYRMIKLGSHVIESRLIV